MLLRITFSPLRLFTQQEWKDIQNTSRDHVLLLCNSNFLRDVHIHKPRSCMDKSELDVDEVVHCIVSIN